MKVTAHIYQLWKILAATREADYIHLGSDQITVHQSTQYHMVGRSKACEDGCAAYSLVQNYTVHSTSPHSTTWWGDQKLVRREVWLTAQHRTLYHFNHDTGSG